MRNKAIPQIAFLGMLLTPLIWGALALTTGNWVLPTLVVVALWIGAAWQYSRDEHEQVTVHTHGICAPELGAQRCIRWEEILTVHLKAEDREPGDDLMTIDWIDLQIEGQSPLRLPRVSGDMGLLYSAVCLGTYRSIIARCFIALLTHQTVTFGKLQVEAAGLRSGRTFVSRTDVAKFVDCRPHLFYFWVYSGAGNVVMTVSQLDTPNAHVLPDVIEFWRNLSASSPDEPA